MPTECQHLCQEKSQAAITPGPGWHSETELAVLIAEEVNWQMADGGLHGGETDGQPQP